MFDFDPLQAPAPHATLGPMRWPWLIFGTLLTCGTVAFSLSADWSSESWLDVAAYAVSIVGIAGVFLYGFGRPRPNAVFWRAFRWLFLGVVALQSLLHMIEVAGQHKYSAAGTVAFIFIAVVLIGWIYVLQWIAMTRLAREQDS